MAILFDIQRFCIHDGPGVRTTLFFKGCPLRCKWCQNPESQSLKPEIAFYQEHCVGCLECMDACPSNAIVDQQDARIDQEQCTACGDCTYACSQNALRLVGKDWNASDLLDEVLLDRDFFMDSGGGITLSGGEPLMHTDFLTEFLPMVQEEGIHITLETCGAASYSRIREILPYIDLIYCDLKIMDQQGHADFTGTSNTLILENFAKLAHEDCDLQARMPVVPGVNNGPDNIRQTASFLKKNNQNSIHLLPYHNLGQSKISRMGSDIEPFAIQITSTQYLTEASLSFEREGIHAIVYE